MSQVPFLRPIIQKTGLPHRNSKRTGRAAPRRTMTTTAKTHIEKVKSLPCCVCGEGPPTDAHHITQGRTPGRKVGDRLTIPLCKDCHQGSINGIHGQRRMWDVMRKSEFDYLDETIERVYG